MTPTNKLITRLQSEIAKINGKDVGDLSDSTIVKLTFRILPTSYYDEIVSEAIVSALDREQQGWDSNE